MDNSVFRLSTIIHASPAKIWKVITEDQYQRQWASAFMEGSFVRSTLQAGEDIHWFQQDGRISAKGKVIEREEPFLLRLQYYDNADPAANATIGDYTESFIIEENEKESRLVVEYGPGDQTDAIKGKWEKALEIIRRLSEQE